MAKIYGVDTEKEVTPDMVRDAIVDCFYAAHRAHLEVDPPDEETERSLVRLRIRKAFENVGGDYDEPTKESLIGVVQDLKSFSTSFRDTAVIEQHAAEIMELMGHMT